MSSSVPDTVPELVWADWQDLGTDRLYALLRLRSEVFVVEQQCVFLDLDGLDPQCLHLCAHLGSRLVGTLRIVPPGLAGTAPAIGRVVTAPDYRGHGLGHLMMRAALTRCVAVHGENPIQLSAQEHLADFYAQHGFGICGPRYLEDGIWHLPMSNPHPMLPSS